MRKISILIIAVAMRHVALSQDADSTKKANPLTITGSIDGYYRYDFHNPKEMPYNSLTSFTRSSNSFELGMASLRADHTFGRVSATIDLGFGRRAEEFAYNDENTRLALKQLYIAYAPSSVVKFTLGAWATHVGYEMPDAYLNRNYSMSYMFANGPFSHTGLKADIALGGKSGLMVGISNPTDYRTAPAMPKSFIGQFSMATKDDKLKAYLNFVGGKQNDYKKVVQGDMVASYAVDSKFSIGINGTLQSIKVDTDSTGKFTSYAWAGVALYLNYDPLTWFGLSARGEYINDKDEFLGLKRVIAPTLSANIRVDNLVIIPEFRLDHAGNAVFYKNAAERSGSTGSFMLAAIYHF